MTAPKTAYVHLTGASSGHRLEFSRRFAECDHNLFLTARRTVIW